MIQRHTSVRASLMAACALLALPVSAQAQDAGKPTGSEESPDIVINNALGPNAPAPGGALDSGINGIGQMITLVQSSPTAVGLSLCSGTLINPRTVIFAAHCVNSKPADAYGSKTGTRGGINFNGLPSSTGTPISFGFSPTNRCTGTNGCAVGAGAYEIWRNSGYNSQTDLNIFNVNQVWYDTRSLEPNAIGFLYADVAMATLDTPATDIPTWAMLFTPLDGPTHGVVTGYGINGTSASVQGSTPCGGAVSCSPPNTIDYRRRVAENMIDALMSLDDRDNFLFGPGNVDNPQTLYQLDFDSPTGPQTVAFPNYDFDLFNGSALPNEGTTAGGDSGGPLIADKAYDRPVVIATLSGGSRFFNGQRFSTYGTNSFYQPLFLFWEEIVANNPYVYATNKAGNGEWTDAAHWIQAMDPNYTIGVDGKLLNALPDFRQDGIAGNGPRFGSVCFLDDCFDTADLSTPLPTSSSPILVPGGPGSTNFVPNNVEPINSATPGQTVKARYYDVTLSATGTTRLSNASVTVDRLTIDGATKLDIAATGALRSLGDFTQWFGWTNIDGTLKTGEAMVATGILSGSGTFSAPYLTVAKAFIVPGGDGKIGTLTVNGNLILTRDTTLYFDASKGAADKIAVTANGKNSGIADLGGTLYFQKVGAAPRFGETYVVLTAEGGVRNTFDKVLGKQGVLRPSVSYGAKDVTVTVFADKLSDNLLSKGSVETAFASTLDKLRTTSYANLSSLYGAIDVMDAGQLTATLRNLNPTIVGETASLGKLQSDQMNSLVAGRLGKLGTSQTGRGRLDILGSPGTLAQLATGQPVNSIAIAQRGFVQGLTPGASMAAALPESMSGFISGNVERSRVANGEAAIRGISERANWNLAMGLESELGDRLTFGSAAGFAQGTANLAGASTEIRTTQAAVYGNYRINRRVYIAGLATVADSRIGLDRSVSNGELGSLLRGNSSAMAYTAHAEAGINLAVASGLTLTPHVAVRYTNFSMDKLHETGGELALRLSNIGEERVEGRVGFNFEGTHVAKAGWSISPQFSAEHVQRLAGNGGTLTARFDAADAVAFNLPFGSRDGSWSELKAGLKFVDGLVSFGAGLETSVGRSDFRDDRAVADFTVRF